MLQQRILRDPGPESQLPEGVVRRSIIGDHLDWTSLRKDFENESLQSRA